MTTKKPKLRYTYDDYRELPDDGNRYEVIDGVLYMAPAPNKRHEIISRTLYFLIWPFVRDAGLGQVFDAPFDVIFHNEEFAQPDLFFVSFDREDLLTERGCEGAPDWTIEILSPSNTFHDRERKRRMYERHGVKEYWLVNPEMRTILVLELVNGEYVTRGTFGVEDEIDTPLIPGLVIPVAQVFEGI